MVEANWRPGRQVIVTLALAGAHAHVKGWAPVVVSAFDHACPVLLVNCYPNASLAAGDLCLIAAAEMVKYASLK